MNRHIPGTKIAEALLTRPEGATMAEIIAATGGPQYNLLKRLKAVGYAIRKTKDADATRYFAVAPPSRTYLATVSGKGQVTLPKAIRERLRLREGQRVRFSVEDGNRVVLSPVVRRLGELHGMLPKPKRVLSLDEIDAAIGRSATERFRRTAGGT
jgi:AbrB family looped-hinge helix DNA binding protein